MFSPKFHHLLVRSAATAVLAAGIAFPALAQPQSGGTLTWVVGNEATALVPVANTGGSGPEIGPKIVEGLLTYDSNLNPKPLLATAWSVSKDGLQYRFTLRQGVKWHDGKDFTSADVAFSILTLKKYNPRGAVTFGNVIDVKTPDAHTAVIELSKPAPYLLTALASTESPIIPKHLYEGTDVLTNRYNSSPVGTGPFIFKEWVKGSYIILERNPNYWDKPKPYLDKIIVKIIPEAAARALAFESGSADLGIQAIPLSDVERFKALPNITVDFRGAPYLGSHQQLCFNFDSPILKHIEVRRAIAQALDINALNKIVWLGYGQVSASPIGPLLARYHDDSIKHEHYDPKQAEALLDAAGYKRGADGVRFKLRLLFNPYQERRAVDFVRQSLAKVGIDAVVESYDFATYVTRTYKDRAFDLTLESLSNTFDPTVGVQRLFATKAFKIGAAFSNPSHYSNPEVDQLLDAAAVEVNENQRKKEFFEFQKIVHNDVASVEFGLHPQITVAAKRVKNYAPTGEGMRGSFADLYLEK